ncbi:MAG TPA: hypothetical protein VGE15_00965 [Sphingobacteriaceae bacterium]
MKKVLLFAVFLIFATADIYAQVTSAVAAKIGAVTELSASGTKDAGVFNFTTVAELTDGLTLSDVFTLTAKSNKPYYISVKAAAANFSGGTAEGPLSVGKLSVSTDGTTFLPLTALDQKLIGSSTNEIRGTKNYPIHYKMVPGFDVAPAQDYSTTLTYTITAP